MTRKASASGPAKSKKKPKRHPVDWDADCGYLGGYLKQIPKPIIRMFPHPQGKKRKVRASIHTWIGFGGRHYYANLDEERNPVWNGLPDEYSPKGYIGWQEPHDDLEGRGNSYHKRFESGMRAITWIERVFRKMFGEKTHVLEHDYSCEDYIKALKKTKEGD